MATIDFRALRSPIFIGALVGTLIGFGLSGTLRASSGGEAAAPSTACSRSVCENILWLRAPILRRTGTR
jgi:hypothetical protein